VLCFLILFVRPVFCVSNIASVSGLSILDCHFDFISYLFKVDEVYEPLSVSLPTSVLSCRIVVFDHHSSCISWFGSSVQYIMEVSILLRIFIFEFIFTVCVRLN